MVNFLTLEKRETSYYYRNGKLLNITKTSNFETSSYRGRGNFSAKLNFTETRKFLTQRIAKLLKITVTRSQEENLLVIIATWNVCILQEHETEKKSRNTKKKKKNVQLHNIQECETTQNRETILELLETNFHYRNVKLLNITITGNKIKNTVKKNACVGQWKLNKNSHHEKRIETAVKWNNKHYKKQCRSPNQKHTFETRQMERKGGKRLASN